MKKIISILLSLFFASPINATVWASGQDLDLPPVFYNIKVNPSYADPSDTFLYYLNLYALEKLPDENIKCRNAFFFSRNFLKDSGYTDEQLLQFRIMHNIRHSINTVPDGNFYSIEMSPDRSLGISRSGNSSNFNKFCKDLFPRQILDTAKRIKTQYPNDVRSRLRAATTFLVDTLEYNHAVFSANTLAECLEKRLAICDEYTYLMCDLCFFLDIPCIRMVSKMLPGETDPHAWNQVYIDGQWKSIDVTWCENDLDEWFLVDIAPGTTYHDISDLEGSDELAKMRQSAIDLIQKKQQIETTVKPEISQNILSQIDASDWAKESIYLAIQKNIVPEHLQTSYKSSISREEACDLTMAFIQSFLPNDIIESMPKIEHPVSFSDTNNHNVHILANTIFGIRSTDSTIFSGVGNNEFNPNGTLTRAEMATICYRILRIADYLLPEYGTVNNTSFIDVNNHWSASYISEPVQNGILQGISPTEFAPNGTLTKEQAIVLFYRFYRLFHPIESY